MTNRPTPAVQNEEEAEAGTERSYAEYSSSQLDFDPLKDLNLPTSYNEVLRRFNRLQGDREPEALN